MGFKLGITIQSLLSQAVIFLRHLAGARLVVGKQQLTEDDPTLYLDQAVHIRFMNRGQTPVIIDNQIILLHGEVYVEGDTAGPGLDHHYDIHFLKQSAEKIASAPDADRPYVFPGNMLDIRILTRKLK